MFKKRIKISVKYLWVGLFASLALLVVASVASNNSDRASSIIPAPFAQTTWLDFDNQTYKLEGASLTFKKGLFKAGGNSGHDAVLASQSLSPSGKRGAVILVDNPGGSGFFYYLIGGMLKGGKQINSAPLLLGDRIKINSLKVENAGPESNGMIIVSYLTRPDSAAMSQDPTVTIIEKYNFEDSGNLTKITR
jgi:hypothetical protein